MEMPYDEYCDYLAEEISPNGVREAAAVFRQLGKFMVSHAGKPATAVPYAGYTLISPPAATDGVNRSLYDCLVAASERLGVFLDRIPLVHAVPAYRHMTIARLVSGKTFAARQVDARYEEVLQEELKRVLSAAAPGSSLFCRVDGIAVLTGGVIAAAVSFASSDDFEKLHQFRDAVYGDEKLSHLGVERARTFRGHISLFYIEGDPDGAVRKELAEEIIAVNQEFFTVPHPFIVHRVELCRFHDFTAFTRCHDWPTVECALPKTAPDPFDFPLLPNGTISCGFLAAGITSFSGACARIAKVPYRRIANPDDPLAVLHEGCGTCGTKHTLLKRLTDEHGQDRVRLMLGIFFWGGDFSTKLGPLLDRSGFTALPEAHCYLRIDGGVVDLTSDTWGPPRFVETLADEIELVSADDAAALKREKHREWMAAWLKREHPDADFETVWTLREACVNALAQ